MLITIIEKLFNQEAYTKMIYKNYYTLHYLTLLKCLFGTRGIIF